jgi:L,D-transpeptidase YcbB
LRHDHESLRNRSIAALVLCLALLGGVCGASAAERLSPSAAALQKVLERYQAIEKKGGWPTVPAGPMLRTGSSGPAVARLRERLTVTGDLTDPGADPGADPQAFDGALAAAVMKFQSRHGLDDDGLVGSRTHAALNVPVDARIRQIAASLERLKSLPAPNGRRTILINVAAFDLLVTEEDRIAFTSPAIAGRLSRPTPVFSSAVTKVVMNPYWDIPRHIAVTDILPKLQRDPSYLSAQSIHVYRIDDSARIEVQPGSINWKSLNSKNFPYELVQDPGPANALGRVKFVLSNDRDIYLHGTPAQALFDQKQRTAGAGGIRVGRALELAEFLLRRDSLSNVRAMAEALQRRESRQIDLKTAVPLHIVALTAWADRDGRAHFRDIAPAPGG